MTDKERQLKWDLRYLELAKHVATWSKDPVVQVGAVLVRPNNSIASTGYNGFPVGHDDSPHLYKDKGYKRKHVVHAEVSAIMFYGKEDLRNYTMYTSFPLCPECTRNCCSHGVSRLVSLPLKEDKTRVFWHAKWQRRIQESEEIAGRHGVDWCILDG